MNQAPQDPPPAVTEGALGLARAYRRRPVVEAEVRALPAPDEPAQLAAAAVTAQFGETVVYAIRQLLRRGRVAAANGLFEHLIDLAAPVFADIARRYFPYAKDDRAELIQRASIQMWREVFDVRPAQEFWEVFFSRMVRLVCISAANAIRRPSKRERPFITDIRPDGEEWHEEDTLAAPSEVVVVDGRRQRLDPLVDLLTGPVQQAVRLRLQGLPEASRDPAVMTISGVMGISDRTVRTYLRRGEQQIREWLADPAQCPS